MFDIRSLAVTEIEWENNASGIIPVRVIPGAINFADFPIAKLVISYYHKDIVVIEGDDLVDKNDATCSIDFAIVKNTINNQYSRKYHYHVIIENDFEKIVLAKGFLKIV